MALMSYQNNYTYLIKEKGLKSSSPRLKYIFQNLGFIKSYLFLFDLCSVIFICKWYASGRVLCVNFQREKLWKSEFETLKLQSVPFNKLLSPH
jgi:hypothetical protein